MRAKSGTPSRATVDPPARAGGLGGEDIEAIVAGRQADPFAVAGLHQAAGSYVIRAFVPDADAVDAVTRTRKHVASVARRHDFNAWEGRLFGNSGRAEAESVPWNGQPCPAALPPSATLGLAHERGA